MKASTEVEVGTYIVTWLHSCLKILPSLASIYKVFVLPSMIKYTSFTVLVLVTTFKRYKSRQTALNLSENALRVNLFMRKLFIARKRFLIRLPRYTRTSVVSSLLSSFY